MKDCPQCEEYKAALRSIWHTWLDLTRRAGKGRLTMPSLVAAANYMGKKARDELKEAEEKGGE